jgi:REP element-mobilizing transposase RayT
MGRPLRIQYPGAWYHITSRGNERKTIFEGSADRKRFLSYLESACERYGAVIHVYCLMANHYHLLIETPRSNLSKILHHINGAYTNYYNVKMKRAGHLFQGRYKAILVDKDAYGQALSRYIHLNSVKAGVVAKPEDYPWSSYRYYIGAKRAPQWLTIDAVLGLFESGSEGAKKYYRGFVEKALTEEVENPLKKVFASTILGSEKFIDWAKERWINLENADTRNIPALRHLTDRPSLQEVDEAVRSALAEEDAGLRIKISLYMSQQYGGYTLKEIGAFYCVSEAAVCQSNRRLRGKIERDEQIKRILSKTKKLLNVET